MMIDSPNPSGSSAVGPNSESVELPARLLITFREAATLTSLGLSSVRKLCETGEWPVVRIGRSVRIPAESVSKWINDRVAETQSAGRPVGSGGRAGPESGNK